MDRLPCTLLIPAAGSSERFRSKTSLPKGLVRFKWRGKVKTMIQHIVPEDWEGSVYVGCQYQHAPLFKEWLPESIGIFSLPPTVGQADTVWKMARRLTSEQEVMVVNSDNGFEPGILEAFLTHCRRSTTVVTTLGALVFRPSAHFERYGYVDNAPIFKVGVEKTQISKFALAGAFYFRSVRELLRFGTPGAYLSEWFFSFPQRKLAFEIEEYELHEWGTAEDLDRKVEEIYWRNEQ